MRIRIDVMTSDDWPTVRQIYAEGIATGNATFETVVRDWPNWDSGHHRECRLVARCGLKTLGWATVSPVSTRRVYSGVAEVSIYVAGTARGQGVGKALLKQLIEASERCGIWALQAGIFPENIASLGLHKSCGFREVGVRQRIGQLAGVWRDVCLLERRSDRVGV
ncbi:MAG: N-acetyltransferase family protein [Terriglobales bacterium]